MASLVARCSLPLRNIFKLSRSCSTQIVKPHNVYKSQCCAVSNFRKFSSNQPKAQKGKVTLQFMIADGDKKSVEAKLGDNLLDVIVENDLEVDGFGACEGTLACSTCHLIFSQEHFDKIEDKPTDEELDMLDLAYSLTDTSRLGCQVIVTKDMEGWLIKIPAGVADARTV